MDQQHPDAWLCRYVSLALIIVRPCTSHDRISQGVGIQIGHSDEVQLCLGFLRTLSFQGACLNFGPTLC